MARGGGGSARGYRQGGVYLRAGSAPERALTTLRAATAKRRHAVTLREWREAHRARTGEGLATIDAIAHRLVARGLVRRADGGDVPWQYVPADAPQPASRGAPKSAQPHHAAAAVVRVACVRRGSAVASADVTRALARRGWQLSSDQVRTILETLCRPDPAGGSEGRRSARPLLECLQERGQFSGQTRRFWRPAGSAYPAPAEVLITRAGLRRAAVHAAVAALGRPVSPVEIRVWALAHPAHPAAAAVGAPRPGRRRGARAALSGARDEGRRSNGDARFTNALRTLVGRSRTRRRAFEGDLVDVSHPLTSDGGLPLRVGVGDLPLMATAACRFTDACAWLRPLDESESVELLRRVALDMPQSQRALQSFADLRAGALAAAFDTALSDAGIDVGATDASDVIAALGERTRQIAETLDAWWQRTAEARYPDVPRWLSDAERAVDVAQRLPDLLQFGQSSCPASSETADLVLVGYGGLRSYAEVEGWLKRVLHAEGRQVRSPREYLLTVRRFPRRDRPRGGPRAAAAEAFSALDVGDVLRVLSDCTSRAGLGVLLARASDLLGHTVRDARALRALMVALPAHDQYHRRAAAVALGALGEAPSPDEVLRDQGDPDDLHAYAFALGLAPLTAEDRRARLAALEVVVALPLRARARELARRAREGDTVTIAM